MALTDSAIRAIKPRDKAYKVADEKGLYLLVSPSGGRLWKLKFRTAAGIEKKLSLGRADAGWYQVRKALEANEDNAPTDFAPFKAAYAALGDKLRPQVFTLGFLPE